VPADVVDAHSHLINLAELTYPWIQHRSAVLEALLSNYYDAAGDYGVGQYRADTAGQPLGQWVACEFGAADPVAEAQWIQRCAQLPGGPSAFIAAVDLTSPALGDVLARYRDLPVVHAVRQPLYWAAEPLRRLGRRPDYLDDPAWWRGFERVAGEQLTWDLLVYSEQLPATHRLIESFPQTPIVLEAAGWPLDQSPDGFRRWQDELAAVSRFPNVTLKLQGLALLFGPSADAVAPWVRAALRIFGPERCLFAAHFPIDRLLWSYRELIQAVRLVLDDLPGEQQQAFFSGSARRAYRLP
jgi:predicted TIM-barrel fold metal-dependent hydrolase